MSRRQGFTPAQRAAARASLEAAKAERDTQTISIPPYSIVHVDEFNWQILGPKLSLDGNYYASAESALENLPRKMLDSVAGGRLDEILMRQNGLVELVRQAIKQAKMLGLLRKEPTT